MVRRGNREESREEKVQSGPEKKIKCSPALFFAVQRKETHEICFRFSDEFKCVQQQGMKEVCSITGTV